MQIQRPYPPRGMEVPSPIGEFSPDSSLRAFTRVQIIEPGGQIHNPDHEHLMQAEVGFLWSNMPNTRKRRDIIGQAEMPRPSGDAWAYGRREQQLRSWFGDVPDFVITLYAPSCAAMDDVAFCALLEHELYHCAQAVDKWGSPAFDKDTGLPKYAIRGHDVEEFTRVVQRYGVTSRELARMVQAAAANPEIGPADVATACGTCLKAA